MTQFKAGDKVQFDEAAVREADRIDRDERGALRKGFASRIIVQDGLESGGVIVRTDYGNDPDIDAPIQIELPGVHGSVWAEEEWLKTPDKFQPGDLVDWVYEDGGIRANGYWSGSEVVERKNFISTGKEAYAVINPNDRGVGLIAAADLVLHKEPIIESVPESLKTADLNKSFSITLYQTGEKMEEGIDISDYITGGDFSFGEFPKISDEALKDLDEEFPEDDMVNHPAHYGGEGDVYEAINVIEAWGLGFHLGNAVKYIPRAGKKDPATEIQDLEKARWYIDRRINNLKEANDE